MADYKVPNLCGASESFNAAQSAFDDLINVAVDGLEIDPSTLKAQAESKLTALTGKLDTMLPELPALPDVNLQAELTSLTGLSPGSFQHTKMLTELTSKFGSALSGGGFSMDSLVSSATDIASGLAGAGDMCSAVPNFSIPAAGGEALQKAIGVVQASEESVDEDGATLNTNVNFTDEKTAVEETFASYEEIGEEVPTEDTGPYMITEETTKISTSDNEGSVSTIEATTSKNSVQISETGGEVTERVTERKRSNVAKGEGFTRRTVRIKEYILLDDVYGSIDLEFTLKNTPISIGSVHGFDPDSGKSGRWRYISKPTSTAAEMDWSDSWTLAADGQTIIVTTHVRDYDTDPKSGYMFKVRYKCLDNYDPNFAGPI